ncbi:hypothetical protein N7468_002850 [Penicillium chermesinum]|uniref:Uncharacterized protein n=1 Tax=Penicillium chermesinum TaxID=63820 RepID=A0A9W9TYD8_9EURO|nr:uncharacterized protein N7468_002850 [Penicillium chermesinum]KAJ5247867.1 hypothetical protein N7468_002850 [Penicillium chermesinum]
MISSGYCRSEVFGHGFIRGLVGIDGTYRAGSRSRDLPSDTRSSSDVFSTARNQINSLVGNTSVSDVSNKATTATSEAANGIKKTVLEDAIPATEEFLNNARDRISTLWSVKATVQMINRPVGTQPVGDQLIVEIPNLVPHR